MCGNIQFPTASWRIMRSCSHGFPFANSKKWNFNGIKIEGAKKGESFWLTEHPDVSWAFSHWSKSAPGEIAKEQSPHGFREHLQPLGTAGKAYRERAVAWSSSLGSNMTQRTQPGDAFVVPLCHREGLGSWMCWWDQSVWRVRRVEEIGEITKALGQTNKNTNKKRNQRVQGGRVPRWYWCKCMIFSGGVLKWGYPKHLGVPMINVTWIPGRGSPISEKP